MALNKEYLDFIMGQLRDLEDITYRAMMVEYILYYKGRIVGGIYDDRLLVKPVKVALAYMPEAEYANPVVLILDEWLLLKPTNSEQRDIFELLHRRRKKSSTIFCSQYAFEEWYEQLGGGDSPLADAIIDRIAHDSYRINITSIDSEHDRSMREVYGLDKELRE